MEHWVSPLAESPQIRFPRQHNARSTRPKSLSQGSISPPRASPEYQGLGIRMRTLLSPTSPEKTYHLSPRATPRAGYSPLSDDENRPRYLNTPDSAVSYDSSTSRSRTDPATQSLIQHRATQAAQWRIHWRTPTLLIVSFLVGMLFAIGQHLLYKSLHHTSEANENKKIRVVLYGRALAYLSKITLGGCVTLCYNQRIWRTFRERALTVRSIDQIFSAIEDPSVFANWEVISNAPLVTFMGLVIWLIPVATIIFSPGALTFGDHMETGISNLMVPILNFTAESYKDWRIPINAPDGSTKRSLLFYNTTDIAGKAQGWFDYYDQPSADLQRISLMTAYSLKNQSLNIADARFVSCGGDFNCTYKISFTGPGYRCQEIASTFDHDQQLADAGAPFNSSVLAPVGNLAYMAEVDIGNYKRPQTDGRLGPGGVPEVLTDDLGVFETEPVLWIGYSINSTERLPPDSPFSTNWTHRFDPHIFGCVHHETRYTVMFNYSGPFVATEVAYDFMSPIINTTFPRNADGSIDHTSPGPASSFVSPRTNVVLYKKTAAYHAMGESLRRFLRGTIELQPPIPGPFFARVASEITMTRLVSNSSSTPLTNLPGLVQSFYADMILSLFSAPQMLVVSKDRAQVNTSRYRSVFIYQPRKLWACYVPVISIVFLFLVLGAWVIMQDGTTFSVGFSRIMVTTRNSTLDFISRGACLGNDPFPPELMNTKLKFGVLTENTEEFTIEYLGSEGLQGIEHCAFGVPSELGPIRKGVPYAGVDVRRDHKIMKKEKVY